MSTDYEKYHNRTQKALLKDSDLFAVKLRDIDRARLALICDTQKLTITEAVRYGLEVAAERTARNA